MEKTETRTREPFVGPPGSSEGERNTDYRVSVTTCLSNLMTVETYLMGPNDTRNCK